MADDKKIIFSMVGVSKTIQQTQKQILKNIYLSFFYGAKIGIIGLNGSGKSTLLYALSGMDKPSMGKVLFGDEDISSYNNDQLARCGRISSPSSVRISLPCVPSAESASIRGFAEEIRITHGTTRKMSPWCA